MAAARSGKCCSRGGGAIAIARFTPATNSLEDARLLDLRSSKKTNPPASSGQALEQPLTGIVTSWFVCSPWGDDEGFSRRGQPRGRLEQIHFDRERASCRDGEQFFLGCVGRDGGFVRRRFRLIRRNDRTVCAGRTWTSRKPEPWVEALQAALSGRGAQSGRRSDHQRS